MKKKLINKYEHTEDYCYFLKNLDNWEWDLSSGYFICVTKHTSFPRKFPWGCGVALFLEATNQPHVMHPAQEPDTFTVTYMVFPSTRKLPWNGEK